MPAESDKKLPVRSTSPADSGDRLAADSEGSNGKQEVAKGIHVGDRVKQSGEDWQVKGSLDGGKVVLYQEGRGQGFAGVYDILTGPPDSKKYSEIKFDGQPKGSRYFADAAGGVYKLSEIGIGSDGSPRLLIATAHDVRLVPPEKLTVAGGDSPATAASGPAAERGGKVGDVVKVDGESFKVAGFQGDNALLYQRGRNQDHAIIPINASEQDLKEKYEAVKVNIDGKDDVRYVAKDNPKDVYEYHNGRLYPNKQFEIRPRQNVTENQVDVRVPRDGERALDRQYGAQFFEGPDGQITRYVLGQDNSIEYSFSTTPEGNTKVERFNSGKPSFTMESVGAVKRTGDDLEGIWRIKFADGVEYKWKGGMTMSRSTGEMGFLDGDGGLLQGIGDGPWSLHNQKEQIDKFKDALKNHDYEEALRSAGDLAKVAGQDNVKNVQEFLQRQAAELKKGGLEVNVSLDYVTERLLSGTHKVPEAKLSVTDAATGNKIDFNSRGEHVLHAPALDGQAAKVFGEDSPEFKEALEKLKNAKPEEGVKPEPQAQADVKAQAAFAEALESHDTDAVNRIIGEMADKKDPHLMEKLREAAQKAGVPITFEDAPRIGDGNPYYTTPEELKTGLQKVFHDYEQENKELGHKLSDAFERNLRDGVSPESLQRLEDDLRELAKKAGDEHTKDLIEYGAEIAHVHDEDLHHLQHPKDSWVDWEGGWHIHVPDPKSGAQDGTLARAKIGDGTDDHPAEAALSPDEPKARSGRELLDKFVEGRKGQDFADFIGNLTNPEEIKRFAHEYGAVHPNVAKPFLVGLFDRIELPKGTHDAWVDALRAMPDPTLIKGTQGATGDLKQVRFDHDRYDVWDGQGGFHFFKDAGKKTITSNEHHLRFEQGQDGIWRARATKSNDLPQVVTAEQIKVLDRALSMEQKAMGAADPAEATSLGLAKTKAKSEAVADSPEAFVEALKKGDVAALDRIVADMAERKDGEVKEYLAKHAEELKRAGYEVKASTWDNTLEHGRDAGALIVDTRTGDKLQLRKGAYPELVAHGDMVFHGDANYDQAMKAFGQQLSARLTELEVKPDATAYGASAAAEKAAVTDQRASAAKPPAIGDDAKFSGETWKVHAVLNDAGLTILKQEGRGTDWAVETTSATKADLEKQYQQFQIGDEKYYVRKGDKTGTVYQESPVPVRDGKIGLWPAYKYAAVPTESLTGKPPASPARPVDGGREKQAQDVKAGGKDAPRSAHDADPDDFVFKDAEGEKEIGTHKVKVRTEGEGTRIFTVDGKEYRLTGSAWYKSPTFTGDDGRPLDHGDVKLHIATRSPSDLAKVQAELIPELIKATQPGGPLHGKLALFKTHDPMYAVQDDWQEKVWINQGRKEYFMPGEKGQNAKGFTLYPTNAKAAQEVYDYVSKFLEEKGLKLEGEVQSGNVADGSLDKSHSNRVSLERDIFEQGSRGYSEGALLSPELNQGMKDLAEKHVKENAKGWEQFKTAADLYEGDPKNGRLKDSALELLAKECKLDPKTTRLTYADPHPGEPVRRLLLISNDGGSSAHNDGFYLTESGTKKTPVYDGEGKLVEGLNGRPAYYEMSKVVGEALARDLDPARVEVAKESTPVKLPPHESAAAGALDRVVQDAERLVKEKQASKRGIFELKEPVKLEFKDKQLTVNAIENIDGKLYLRGADGTRYRAEPWLDAIREGLAARAHAKELPREQRESALNAISAFNTSVEAKVALLKELASNLAETTAPLAQATVAAPSLRKGAAPGAAPGGAASGGQVATGGADIRQGEGGGYEVGGAGAEGNRGEVSTGEIKPEDIAEMKEAILKDKDSKYTPEEKARALKVLELAESGNVEARDAVRSARNEAAKRGGIDGTTATLVGVGIVVGVLAGWYAYKKLSEAREPYVAKVPVR